MHANSHKHKTDSELAEDEAESAKLYAMWKETSGAGDAECALTDELTKAPGWWFLEFIPFVDSNQNEHGTWKDSIRYVFILFHFSIDFFLVTNHVLLFSPFSVNWFRPRNIPFPPDHTNPNSRYNPSKLGVSITDAPALFHISVKHRMKTVNVPTWRTLWRKPDPTVFYTPKAWPPGGEPVYVE